MRRPQEAPQLHELMDGLAQIEWPSVIKHAQSLAADESYLHWDELRRRSSPSGLSHEQWWFCLKFSRSPQMREIPLTSVNGDHFTYFLPQRAQRLLEGITQQASGTVRGSDLIINPVTRDEYLLRNLMEEGIESSLMEGADTTRAKAKEAIRSQRKTLTEGERMAVNNYNAMQYVQTLRKDDLTPSIIYKLHTILTQGTMADEEIGRHRRPDEPADVVDIRDGLTMHDPPPAEQLPRRIQAMCDFANASEPFIHPVVRSIVLHFWLAYDHPFIDGNGRCARGLFYWSMLRHDYWLCQYFSISEILQKAPAKYGRAFLHTETDGNDLVYFILHQLDVIRQATDKLYAYLARKSSEQLSPKLLAKFNERQCQVINRAQRRPDSSFSISHHQTIHGVVYQTARTDLLDLWEKGLLTREKIGKTFVFRPASDIKSRLEEL